MEQLTMKDFEAQCKALCEKKELVDKLTAELKKENALYAEMKDKVLVTLEALGKTSYPVSGFGTVYIQDRFQVKMPTTPEGKSLLFKWLNKKGVLWDYATVHHQSLNSLYKEEFDNAVREGNENFTLPGVGEPTSYKTLAVKAR